MIGTLEKSRTIHAELSVSRTHAHLLGQLYQVKMSVTRQLGRNHNILLDRRAPCGVVLRQPVAQVRPHGRVQRTKALAAVIFCGHGVVWAECAIFAAHNAKEGLTRDGDAVFAFNDLLVRGKSAWRRKA